MRERDMNPKAKGRLAQVLNGVEDAVGQSIDQQVAAEQQAVAAGQMNPEDTLANRLHADAQRVAGQGDMAGLSAGNEGALPHQRNAIPRDEGTRGRLTSDLPLLRACRDFRKKLEATGSLSRP